MTSVYFNQNKRRIIMFAFFGKLVIKALPYLKECISVAAKLAVNKVLEMVAAKVIKKTKTKTKEYSNFMEQFIDKLFPKPAKSIFA